MARRVSRFLKEDFLFFVFLAALFLSITALVLVLLSGKSRRESLLLEYEAQKIASALIETFRDERSLDLEALEEQVVGFGIYTAGGTAVQRFGSAPASLQVPENLTDRGSFQRAIVSFHRDRKTLTLVRWIGMAPGFMEMHRRAPRMMQPFMERMRTEGLRLLFLELSVEGYWASRRVYRATSILAPLLILVVMVFVGFLYRKNSLYRKKLAAQQQLAHLGEISRTLSHEIKNPLSAIRIQTGILGRTLPERSRGDLKIIEEEVARLSVLTDRIGDFLRDPVGQPELLDLGSFIAEMILRYDRNIAFVDRSGEKLRVRFDRQRLRSVLENLINNALESVEQLRAAGAAGREAEEPPAGAENQKTGETAPSPVAIVLSAAKNRLEISILDRGEGMPEELLQKIFDPFYTSKTSGSGVGLAIAKRFVEAAGGTLSLRNRKGGGAQATIVLNRESP
jgi:two-component system sensor histidine kinase HydH